MFINRTDAAMQLAEKLQKYKGEDGVILAIPRGGVPIGYIIAKELKFPLDIILSKKIGHPRNPEYAIGSVSLDGAIIDENVLDVSSEYIRNESERILISLKSKYNYYSGNRKPIDLKNKTVIIVDDGIATGHTIKASVLSVKKHNPKAIIIAVPVAPLATASRLNSIVDEFICVLFPHDFRGVGEFYEDFSQVSDEEVIQLLEKANLKVA